MWTKAGGGWQKDAHAAGLVVSTLELWLERYRSGQSAEVWAEMRDLGPEIRTARAFGTQNPRIKRNCTAHRGTGLK
jgi:hypothetical protein